MKSLCFALLFFVLFGTGSATFAQATDDAQSLVKEAVKLNNDGKYADAVDKYTQALKLDPDNMSANYGIAFSLLSLNKGDEGIPYLQKVINANNKLTTWAYDLLGSVYDKDKNTSKAIEAYKAGIKIDPAYQSLHYNLGLVYFRSKDYAEAEKCFAESIKLDPKHANSQRVYALVCFHQNKRANALLGLCSFILLEPNTARSTEAFGNIQHILQGGNLKVEPGVSLPAFDANSAALNNAISKAVLDAGKAKYASAGDLLSAQLTAIFNAIGPLADKQTGDDLFRKYYAAYFYQLAQSAHMPAFARMMNQANPENAKWITDHPLYMNELYTWIKTTPRDL